MTSIAPRWLMAINQQDPKPINHRASQHSASNSSVQRAYPAGGLLQAIETIFAFCPSSSFSFRRFGRGRSLSAALRPPRSYSSRTRRMTRGYVPRPSATSCTHRPLSKSCSAFRRSHLRLVSSARSSATNCFLSRAVSLTVVSGGRTALFDQNAATLSSVLIKNRTRQD